MVVTKSKAVILENDRSPITLTRRRTHSSAIVVRAAPRARMSREEVRPNMLLTNGGATCPFRSDQAPAPDDGLEGHLQGVSHAHILPGFRKLLQSDLTVAILVGELDVLLQPLSPL